MKQPGPATCAALLVWLALPAAAAATFPGGNGRIVYPGITSDGLWTARSDGSFRTPLVRVRSAWQPKWSADGKRVVFIANPRDTLNGWEIYKVRADGRKLRRVTWNGTIDRSPSWSPDGHRIAFVRTLPDGSGELWTMGADGRHRRFVARARGVGFAEWSPDGSLIAYESPDHEIHVVDPDGGASLAVTNVPGLATAEEPSWSPDGRWLAYTEQSGCGPCDGDTSLAKVRRDGTRRQSLEPRRRFKAWTGAPRWSPDGRFIAFCQGGWDRAREGRWLMHPDGSARRRVSPVACTSDWQPRL